MSISRAKKIAESLRTQFGYDTEFGVEIAPVGPVDVLAMLGGQPVNCLPSGLITLGATLGLGLIYILFSCKGSVV